LDWTYSAAPNSYRRTLVGLKHDELGAPPTRCARYRRTLVGLKLVRQRLDHLVEQVTDEPSWG